MSAVLPQNTDCYCFFSVRFSQIQIAAFLSVKFCQALTDSNGCCMPATLSNIHRCKISGNPIQLHMLSVYRSKEHSTLHLGNRLDNEGSKFISLLTRRVALHSLPGMWPVSIQLQRMVFQCCPKQAPGLLSQWTSLALGGCNSSQSCTVRTIQAVFPQASWACSERFSHSPYEALLRLRIQFEEPTIPLMLMALWLDNKEEILTIHFTFTWLAPYQYCWGQVLPASSSKAHLTRKCLK